MNKLHKLKKLSVSKVSLVPKGSNPEADVVFYKSKDVTRATFSEIMAGEVLRGVLYKIYDACYVMQDSISSAFSAEDSAAETRASIAQFKKYVDDLLDDLEAGKVKKEDLNLESIATNLITRHNAWVEKIAPTPNKETVMKKAFKDMNAEEQAAHVADLERQLAEKTTTPPPAEPATPATEEVLRGLTPEAQAIFKAQETQLAALTASNAATAAVVAKMAEEADIRKFVDIARAEIPNLRGTHQEKGEMLRTLSGLGKEAYEKQLVQLKAANAALNGFLTEVGRGGEGSDVDDSPAAQMEAIAKKIVSDDTTGKTTYPVAYARACKDNTDLYAQMRRARFNSGRVA